ncbi:hypothetical protein AX16_007766 [Volvariella volvacea WC 439]|nr:hypothetical protein AX16_007766 [Volvariella volvacea WC 439]
MPLRRPSASLGPMTSPIYASSTRVVHRSNESHPIYHNPQPPSSLAIGATPTPQQKIVQVLITRLKHKLPCNSGLPLDRLEADSATQQAIESLTDLAHDSLDVIAWALSELLDRLAKQVDPNNSWSIEVLQSQLFVLKVLAVVLASRWSHDSRNGVAPPANTHPRSPTSPPPDSASSRTTQHSVSSETSGTVVAIEPAPLDDNCAKYVLSVMVLFLRQTASSDNPLMLPSQSSDISFRDFELMETIPSGPTANQMKVPAPPPPTVLIERGLRSQPSSSSVRSGKLTINTTIHLPAASTKYERTHMSMTTSAFPVNSLIAKYAGRIIFQISASNWDVVFDRLRAKFDLLASSNEDAPDTVDLKLMAHCALDRSRLILLLNTLSSLLVSMRPEARIAVAAPLRAAIWSWIELFPHEFDESLRVRGKNEGAPERLFDLFYAISGPGTERDFWPTLTVLNCMSSERLTSDFQISRYGSGSKPHRKEVKFWEDIFKHATTGSRHAEVALVCALDVCRAATHVKPEGEVPLRMIAYDIAHEIKSALTITSSGKKPFWESYEEIDIAMYAEAMVACYRFLPLEDVMPLFRICVEPERSDAVKTCAARACLTLVQEAPRLTWQKPLDKLEELMARRWRDIFKTVGVRRQEIDQYGNPKRIAPRPKSKRKPGMIISDREILLLGILSLWRSNPFFYLSNIQESDIDEWVNTAVRLWEASIDDSVKVSTASCFKMVADMAFLLKPGDFFYKLMIKLIKSCLPATLLSISMNLVNSTIDLEAQRMWIGLAHQTVELFVRRSDAPHVKDIQYDIGRIPAFLMAEIAFLISLTSADTNVSQLAGKGLRLLSHAERQEGAPVNPIVRDADRSKRNPFYEQLGDPRVQVIGRVGHQKRIRKIIRLMASPTALHAAVWSDCYWRWVALSEKFGYIYNDELDMPLAQPPQDQRFQWQNITLFLAALSAACVLDDPVELNALSTLVPQQFLPDRMRAIRAPGVYITHFIESLVKLLVCADLQVRDTAREALGTELSPRLYGKLLKIVDDHMHTIAQDPDTEKCLVFLSEFISVLKMIVENSHVNMEDVMTIDISSIVYHVVVFVNRFSGPSSLRIKTRFCVMCDSVCDRTDTLTLRKDSSLRRAILDVVLDWMQLPSDREPETVPLQTDLNLACLRTSVKLLDRLQLKAMETSNTGDDTMHVVSRHFNKYSTALLRGLELCQLDMPSSDSCSDIGSIHQKMKLAQREATLRELVITGLAHLVSANTESGFKQCLPLAYDQDNRKRTIFAHVFARVLGQGTKFDPEDRSTTVSRSARLYELVRGYNMTVALAICEVCPPSEVEMMISVLLNIFDTRQSLMSLIKLMIEREVAQTDGEANLFRSNSTCTRMLSAFAKIHGYNYLRSLIQPLVHTMSSKPPGLGYDIDPQKVSEPELSQNVQNVKVVAASFLEIISSSITILPSMFREICAHIAKVVSQIWPDSKFAAMGAFIFLRFISPAIVAPEIVDIELPKNDAPLLRRGLKVIAKIIQNLANNIFFGKEAHMTVLNKFLQENITNVTRFLSEIHKYTVVENDDEWLGTTSDDTDFIVLHRFFDKHADKVGKELLSMSRPSSEGESLNGKKAWDALCALLVDLGAPLEVPRCSPYPCSEHQEYKDLMQRYAHRDTSSVAEIFQETSVPSGQPAIFILRLSKIDVEALDIELLLYHIFKIMSMPTYRDRYFEVILDCTSFTSISEVPLQWLKYCAELIPSDIRSQILATHILNPNALTQRYLRRLYNVSAGTRFCGEIRAYTSVTELKDHVPPQVLPSLAYASRLEDESSETFKEVTMKVPQLRMPIVLNIGTTHIRITSVKAQPISPGLSCRSTEIIPLADVSDIYNVSTGHEANEFIIRRSRQGVTVYFSSQHREQIIKTIRSAKGKLKETHLPLTERFSRFSNVPATLLHVGLLSVDPIDEELRGAAYDLLGGVCTYLNYDKSPIVACKAGFIPGDPTTFVSSLSEAIADFAPQLTLDFISEVSAALNGMSKEAVGLRIRCLQYMSPWVKNLAFFADPTHKLFERSGARLRDCIRVLADLSISFPEVASTIQKYVWAEVSKLDTGVVDVILDELVRAAADGGIGTKRCETIAQIIASLSSISVRGRIYSKLRKALSKASAKVANTLPDHANWNEISTLIRLALVAGSQAKHPSHHQLYVPEIIHLVNLVAGVGPTLVRKSVYGIVMNLLQALYLARAEDSPGPELLQLISDCETPEIRKLFGLARETPTSEYGTWDPPSDKATLDNQEKLAKLLVRILDTTAGSKGLLNVWRARWMSLVTATAFQLSPAIQTRSFIALGTLTTAEVDDDFLYQILVALRMALLKANESHTMSVVSMLRCMCKIIPALQENSRYLCPLFWLAVALLQSSHIAFYPEATRLLQVILESMERQGMFENVPMATLLLDARLPLEEVTSQLDELLKISFSTSFSFALAAIIFKGVRHSSLRESAESALRCLLGVTVRSHEHAQATPDACKDTVCPDALGYFIALLSLSTTKSLYERLLTESGIDEAWHADAGLPEGTDEEMGVPRVSPSFLGVNDAATALLVCSFVNTMLLTAQGDDTESEILYSVLADIGMEYPEIAAMIYESIQKRVEDTIAQSSNASVIHSVSRIFQIAVAESMPRFGTTLRGSSASTLNTLDDTSTVTVGPGRGHLSALEELGMQGLGSGFQFLPANRGHATKMINWIPGLVNLIISS